eukprot:TRINITY_DN57363_c0_g1_i1.p2 TRINITY_DN57363_c0_g1~~TRINITY_DN57363_c0_g1_i1.p2  ORF type:complete len:144 (-),score=3.65 TRINITY_DN57363_c0_g1_i1:339-770(-)
MGDEVTNAINALPVDFRVVILLCDIEGFTYEEIAKIVDIPIGTVRSRLHRARFMLKVELRNYAASLGYQDKRSKQFYNQKLFSFSPRSQPGAFFSEQLSLLRKKSFRRKRGGQVSLLIKMSFQVHFEKINQRHVTEHSIYRSV